MLRSKGVPIIRKLSALVGTEPTIVEQLNHHSICSGDVEEMLHLQRDK